MKKKILKYMLSILKKNRKKTELDSPILFI